MGLKCGWPTCHFHGGGVVRDSVVRDEPAGGGVAVARVPQLGVGALRGVDGHMLPLEHYVGFPLKRKG